VKPLRYDPRAREEYAAAALWYAERNPEAAERFRLLIRGSEDAVQDAPDRSPFVPKVPRHLEVRRHVLQDFPYSLVYVELTNEILIVAVAHAKRRPGYWRNRVPPSGLTL
jgi:plasmid stabilization system protein ParE